MYEPGNIFAKIIRGEIATNKVYEDEYVIAIYDLHPVAPVHILVIPKGDYIDYDDFVSKAGILQVADYFQKVSKIANTATTDGYRLVTNVGKRSGQTIFHFHTHIISGKEFTNIAG